MNLAARVIEHYRLHARALPWRRAGITAYEIWVCEIMAQQTRLETMIPYWQRWMVRFPTVEALALAPLDDVLAAWSGLGYYARARSLHRAARHVVDVLGGVFPDDLDGLAALPGIGRYTAGAIASIAFGARAAVVDGNVIRVFARLHGIEEDVTSPTARRRLWTLAEQLVPARAGDFNQGLMDLGATICTPRSPRCHACPLSSGCHARRHGRQAELPVVGRRGAVPRIEIDSAWIVEDGQFLLMRRVPSGLFGGLWELPEVTALGAVEVDRAPVLATHTHKLTHRTIVYRVYRAHLESTIPRPTPPYDSARFMREAGLASLGVSSATSALISQLGNERTSWPRPNGQPSSSSRATRRSSPGSVSSATTSTTTTSPTRRDGRRARSPR